MTSENRSLNQSQVQEASFWVLFQNDGRDVLPVSRRELSEANETLAE
jgi:hypothetical protein